MHNFILGPADTDSISFCKADMSEFTEDEKKELLNEINNLMPKLVQFADDGYYECCIALKTKNYVLKKYGEAPKYKGASFKNQNKEPKLREFMKEIVKEIGLDRNNFISVYNKYVREIMDIKDITGWSTKKTITSKVKNGTRANETKVLDVIEDTDYREGDRIYTYYKPDKSLGLREEFNGDYCKVTLLKKLYKTVEIFKTVIDITIFPNYSLKRHKKALEELLNDKSNAS